jgi:hypothetical protein
MEQGRSEGGVETRLGTQVDLHAFVALLEDAETRLLARGIRQCGSGFESRRARSAWPDRETAAA